MMDLDGRAESLVGFPVRVMFGTDHYWEVYGVVGQCFELSAALPTINVTTQLFSHFFASHNTPSKYAQKFW